jgi:hypothetical protein
MIIEQIDVFGVDNMKNIFTILFSLLIASSIASASNSAKINITAMAEVDCQLLFNSHNDNYLENMNITILNDTEMVHTNAKGWLSRAWKRLRTFFRRHVNLEGRNAHRRYYYR